MTVKELIKKLSSYDEDKAVRFYFLKDENLNGCEFETLIQSDLGVEFTLQDEEELGVV